MMLYGIQRCRHGRVPRDSRAAQSSGAGSSSVSSSDSREFSREEARFRLFSAGWAGGGSLTLPRDTRRMSVLLARALATDTGGGGAGSGTPPSTIANTSSSEHR